MAFLSPPISFVAAGLGKRPKGRGKKGVFSRPPFYLKPVARGEQERGGALKNTKTGLGRVGSTIKSALLNPPRVKKLRVENFLGSRTALNSKRQGTVLILVNLTGTS
jgi:hypothetical protein